MPDIIDNYPLEELLMHPQRKNIRLRGYDYSSEGLYFITICTKNRNHYFGIIENEEFDYSPIGAIAYTYWNEIPKHFPNIAFGWQSRFHVHIIRDEPEFYRIENYILNNVKNWGNDKFLK